MKNTRVVLCLGLTVLAAVAGLGVLGPRAGADEKTVSADRPAAAPKWSSAQITVGLPSQGRFVQ